MAAAKLNIELEEHSDLNFDFTYLDETKTPVDISNYGGLILFSADSNTKPFASGTHNDGWLQLGGADGKIITAVPYTAYENLSLQKGIWQLFIHPTANDITDRPKRLIAGEFIYKPSPLKFLGL